MGKAKRVRKRKKTNKRLTQYRRARDASGGHDRKSGRKYRRGGRVEAYTIREAL